MCDDQFEEVLVVAVRVEDDGWAIKRDDGWTYFLPKPSPVEPKAGMLARFYGRGFGSNVRGLFLDGQKVFYRTEAEDKEKREIEMYGADAADWLDRWDDGHTVWTIEMGGIGPGYEQCIHITVAEILRHMVDRKYDALAWSAPDVWKSDIAAIEGAGSKNERVEALKLSGAQWGSALSLALQFYMRGPRAVMTDESAKDRHIQVSRVWPG